MPIVVQRSFTITPGSLEEFERLSREEIWPYMEARGCKIVGLFTNLHGGPSNEVILHTAYDSMTHWEATRPRNIPAGLSPEVAELGRRAGAAVLARNKLTLVSSTRVLNLVTDWVDLGTYAG